MPLTTAKQKREILRLVNDKLERALEINALSDGLAVWKPIFFLLDRFNTGSFYGTIEFKIEGSKVKEPKITNQTFKIANVYPDFEE